jgi:predicted AlkP superfamily phosphohydrolase/phosphomutase
MKSKKLMVIGLDCAAPSLIFERWRDQLPNLSRLMEKGVYGELTSTIPPITVPAWSCMMSSKDPGQIGIYGFRNRKDHSYNGLSFANSNSLKVDMVWDILGKNDKKSIVIGFPPSYPVKPINGHLVSCFLTPDAKSQYTHPPELKTELEEHVGPYIPDVLNFRTDDKEYLLEQLYAMTKNHFDYAEYLVANKEWDYFFMVDMGVDRIHHGMWKFSDPSHAGFVPGNQYENSIRDFYIYSDKRIGELLELVDSDTTVMVVSDHGAKSMVGGICINEWFIKEGYLKLTGTPEGLQPPIKVGIDWDQTTAWGEGGYYSRIFLNVQGREENGTIAPEDYEKVRDELISKLEALGDEEGNHIGTKVFRPEDIYKEVNGVAPDLIAIFGDLNWRSVGTVGHGSVHTRKNDTGPDDANHAQEGIYILNAPEVPQTSSPQHAHIYDVAPTILKLYDIPAPGDWIGKPFDFV